MSLAKTRLGDFVWARSGRIRRLAGIRWGGSCAWALAREPDQELKGLTAVLVRAAVAATGILAIVAVFGLCVAFVRHLHLLNWIVGRLVLLGTNGKHFRTCNASTTPNMDH